MVSRDCFFRMFRRVTSRIPPNRAVKHITGGHEKGNRSTIYNHRHDIGKLTQVRQHDDHFKATKKSSTLAYPEDAVIDASNDTAVCRQRHFNCMQG